MDLNIFRASNDSKHFGGRILKSKCTPLSSTSINFKIEWTSAILKSGKKNEAAENADVQCHTKLYVFALMVLLNIFFIYSIEDLSSGFKASIDFSIFAMISPSSKSLHAYSIIGSRENSPFLNLR